MEHTSCIIAIERMRNKQSASNVHDTKEKCVCGHEPTPCDWVGNGRMYACLADKSIEPQRVYTHMNGTKMARLSSPEKRR